VKNLSLAIFFCAAALASAQTTPTPTSTVTRTTKAVHYRLQGGSTKIDFQGTDLLRGASGEARVEGKKTNFQIEVKFQNLEDATKFGLEYLTYVLWAVSPQGRPVNLGEVTLDHNNAHLKAFTDLQTFGMIVTAEPYFAVTAPGNMVVMESAPATGAGTENIEAKYDLVSRGTYSSTNTHIQDAIFGIDSKTPLELFEARNALRIARIAAGDKYAPFIISKAGQQLMHAEEAYRQKQNKAAVEAAAKEATETADLAEHLLAKGPLGEVFDPLLGAVAAGDVDSGVGIGYRTGCCSGVWLCAAGSFRQGESVVAESGTQPCSGEIDSPARLVRKHSV